MIEGWRPFFGSDPPNDETRVRVRLRSGSEFSCEAVHLFWGFRNALSDIVQYRVDPHREIKYNPVTWTSWDGRGAPPVGICHVQLRDGTLLCGDSRQFNWNREHKHKLNYITAYKIIAALTDDFLP